MDNLEIAERFFSAVEAGRWDVVRSVVSPDAVIWHNYDQTEKGVDVLVGTLTWVSQNVRGKRYDRVSRAKTPNGFVQQHVVTGTSPAGIDFLMPSCVVATIDNGRITRINEYVDSRHLQIASGATEWPPRHKAAPLASTPEGARVGPKLSQ